jgi:hypothetical protein
MISAWILVLVAGALNITPPPQEIVEEGKGFFAVLPMTPVVVADDASEAELAAVEAFLEAIGQDLPVLQAAMVKPGNEAIYIGEPDRHAAFGKRPLRTNAEVVAALKPGGYVLSITRKTVVVAGRDVSGTAAGLQTLLQIARANPQGWPCVDIRDWPETPWRGVWADAPLSEAQLAALAAARCNYVVFDSADFADLSGERAERWQATFAAARRVQIEPIPVLRVFNGAETLLRLAPAAAEGLTVTNRVTLLGDDPSRLLQRNVLAGSPMRVTMSGAACAAREDYLLEPALLEAPFTEDAAPSLIRRVPGGKIPDGATVDVTYSFVPAASQALCPHAPETAKLMDRVFARMAEVLRPRYVHLGLETIARLNQDLRCLAQKKSRADILSDGLNLAASAMKKSLPDAHLMVWADALNPVQDAPRYGLTGAPAHLPENMVLTVRWPSNPRASEALRAWCREQARPMVLTVSDAPGARAAIGTAQQNGQFGGMLFRGPDPAGKESLAALSGAWSGGSQPLPWPMGLNAFFGASLLQPETTQRFQALANALDSRTLAGQAPAQSYQEFVAVRDALARRLPKGDPELDTVNQLYANLTSYLALESDFSTRPDNLLLRKLVDLVNAQAQIDPELATTRLPRIVETIEQQGLFVPASILFGAPVLYYRPLTLPPGVRLLEIPVKAEFKDDAQRARAVWNLQAPFAVRRIDYETIGANRVLLETSSDGKTYQQAKVWTAAQGASVRGPALVEQLPAASYLRLTVESSGPVAVLRETRLFALKGSAAARCPYVADAGRSRNVNAPEWSGPPQAAGFVRTDSRQFAEAPTEVRLCRNRTHLFIGVSAREPRMHAMQASITARDGRLQEEESIEAVLDTGGTPPVTLMVNPLGAQFDSRAGDTAWNGPWQAMTEKGSEGWAAVLAIPFETLGGPPKPGAKWRANFYRNRCNVTRERSAWVHDDDVPASYQTGIITFD